MDSTNHKSTKKSRKRQNGEGSYRERTLRKTDAAGRPVEYRYWEYRFKLPNGTRKTLTAKTLEELKAKRAEAEKGIAQGLDISRPDITVREYLDAWLIDTARHSVRTRTFEAYAQLAATHINPAVGDFRLNRLRVEHVEQMMRGMVAAGLTPSTAQRARAVLRRCLKFALRDQLVTRNVASLAEAPKSTAQPKRPLSPEQTRRFLDTMRESDHRYWTLFTVAASTGMRAGELYGLRWRDIDWEAGTLTVGQTVLNVKGGWTFGDGKTRKSLRTCPLIPDAIEALRAERVRQNVARLAAGGDWSDHGLIFTNSKGNPLNASNVNRALHEALESCDLPRHGLHIFRHGCGTMLAAAGVPYPIIAAWLGHSVLETTTRYTHPTDDGFSDAANRLGAALKTG